MPIYPIAYIQYITGGIKMDAPIIQGNAVNVQELAKHNNTKRHNIANADTAASQVINQGNPSATLEIGRDIPINDNFSKSNMVFTSEAKSISDILALNFRSVDDGIRAVHNALAMNSNKSFYEMAKIFEDESALIKSLTNISENEKDSRLHLLERGFAEASYWLFFESTISLKDMDSLVNFADNAAKNIDIIGLKDETKNLLFEGLSRAVTGSFNDIRNKAINAEITQYLETVKQKNRYKLSIPDDEQTKQLRQYRAELFNKYLEALKKLDWLSLDSPKMRKFDEDNLINTTDKENAIEESANDDTSPEVSETDDSSEETPSENAANDE
jgi:hypothetical protein